MPFKDPKKQKAYDRERQKRLRADPEYVKLERERTKLCTEKRTIKNKSKAIEYTGGLQCHNPNCVYIKHGETLELCQIDFHHVIEQNKTGNFGTMFASNKWETVKLEIDNCKAMPLCRNCHSLETWGTDEERFGHILDA